MNFIILYLMMDNETLTKSEESVVPNLITRMVPQSSRLIHFQIQLPYLHICFFSLFFCSKIRTISRNAVEILSPI
jgi:hypothetical protein